MACPTSHHKTQATDVSPTFTRRVLAKAAAGFAAAAALAGVTTTPQPAVAKGTTTLAGEWSPEEGTGGDGSYVEFSANIPFRAIAPHWSGATDLNGAVEVSVSADGSVWTDPVVLGPSNADAGRPDRDGRTFGHLMMTEEARHVRYRTLDANGAPAILPDLAFTYIDASDGPTLDDVASPAIGGSLVKPPIIKRNQWGANLAYDGWDGGTSEWSADYRTVKHIIIHHSETPNFRDPLVEIRSIHYYHTVTRGWGDIGYNFLVDYLGNVYEGRKGGENVVGGHAFQYAYGSAGVCSMGAFSLQTSTPEAIGALVWISAWAGRNLDLLGHQDFHETPNCPTICGHRDVVNSSCPGDSLYADLPYIRTAAAEVLAGSREAGIPTDYAAGDVIEVTVDGANLRSQPGTSAPVTGTLPAGKVMTVVEGPTTTNGYEWYRVSGESNAGWMASTLFTSSASPAPEREYTNGSRVEVATNLLNIRSDPGLYGGIVATLPQGDLATVVGGPEVHGGVTWLKVDSNLGTGWVSQQYLAPSGRTWVASSFTIGDAVVIATDRLNVRTDASTNARVIVQLWTGERAKVVDGPRKSAGNVWLKIESDRGTGWTPEKYLSDAGAPPPSEALFAVGDNVTVDTDRLNLRREAGTNGPVVAVLYNGETASIVDGHVWQDGYNWFRLDTERGAGWGVEDYLAAEGSAAPSTGGLEVGTSISVTTDSVNLRESADTTGRILQKLTFGNSGSVAGGTVQSDGYSWVLADFNGTLGWIATAYVGRASGSPAYSGDLETGMEAEVVSDHVNVRPSASLGGSVLGQLWTGDVVSVVDGPVQAEGYTWFKVKSSRWTGWVVESWLTSKIGSSIRVGASVRVFGGELNLRSGPSTSDAVVRKLPDGAIAEVLDGPENANGYDWYRVSSSRYGTGWTVSAWLERA